MRCGDTPIRRNFANGNEARRAKGRGQTGGGALRHRRQAEGGMALANRASPQAQPGIASGPALLVSRSACGGDATPPEHRRQLNARPDQELFPRPL